MYEERELKWFDRLGVKRPTHTPHNVKLDDIAENLKELKITRWRLEGNQLTGMTDMGPFTQTIPTDVILEGVDDEGLPKFRKVIL